MANHKSTSSSVSRTKQSTQRIEQRYQIFIDSVLQYFHQLKIEIAIDTPYLKTNQHPILWDYTGIIGITGNQKGLVYFTAPTALLEQLLLAIDEQDCSDENLIDLVGEFANTIAGNARKDFGADFNISVPLVVKGKPDHLILPRNGHSFVVPIHWQEHQAAIVVFLQG